MPEKHQYLLAGHGVSVGAARVFARHLFFFRIIILFFLFFRRRLLRTLGACAGRSFRMPQSEASELETSEQVERLLRERALFRTGQDRLALWWSGHLFSFCVDS